MNITVGDFYYTSVLVVGVGGSRFIHVHVDVTLYVYMYVPFDLPLFSTGPRRRGEMVAIAINLPSTRC